ncbi:carbonic anhydrase [Facilibium subflavum]|uniref:carbonic anhydrase n=1 Tax=Facilibium subflavum TaxID=2219058 RepID=UPI000E659EBC|nr:carbonic anhydrase [Facilibium subflavum]
MLKIFQMTVLSVFFALFSYQFTLAEGVSVVSAQKQANLTPDEVLQRLAQGNKRFVADKKQGKTHLLDALYSAKKGQNPLALVFNCVDSRSIANYVFDEGIGNIFVARIAGNVADENVLGSMEFAAVHAGVKAIVVMGHTQCGAVAAACQGDETGTPALDQLLDQIQPAVSIVKKEEGDAFSCNKPDTIDAIAKQNVQDQIKYIVANSKDLADMVKDKKIALVGAMHNIKTGQVTFFDQSGKVLTFS